MGREVNIAMLRIISLIEVIPEPVVALVDDISLRLLVYACECVTKC